MEELPLVINGVGVVGTIVVYNEVVSTVVARYDGDVYTVVSAEAEEIVDTPRRDCQPEPE